VRRLRERATDRLFDADGHALQRIAAASKLLPAAVAAAIGQRAFGPLLCARIAGRLDPGRGVDLAARLPAEFLADVAVELDPRRAGEIIVLDLITHLHKPLLRRLAALPEVDDPKIMDPLVRTAVEEGVWEELLPLVHLLPASPRARVKAGLRAR
jgi:hypothetical protein